MSNKLARFAPQAGVARIEGLSAVLRMPRLGKIRLGVKAKSAKTGAEYPKDVDYFVCPEEVRAVYGQEPKKLDVLFPCDDATMFFPQALKLYGGGRLLCKGNGKTAMCIDQATGEMTEKPCPCERYTRKEPKPDCKAVGNLMIILPDVSMGGCYQIDTGSTGNIINLNSAISWIRGMLGRIAFVPLTLARVPTKIQTPDGPTTKALLHLRFNGTMRDAAKYRKADAITMAALPPAAEESHDDDDPVMIITEQDPPALEGEGLETPTHEDAPGSTISTPVAVPDPGPAPQVDRPASPAPSQPAGVKPAVSTTPPSSPLPAGKIRMLESLFRGKGISGKEEVNKQIQDWYGVPIVELPASSFDEVKARIATLAAGPF